MQKVVGSNPIIRSSTGPAQTGLFVASIGTMTVCSTSLEPGVIDHKYYARGVGTVPEQTVKGGDERNELVSFQPEA